MGPLIVETEIELNPSLFETPSFGGNQKMLQQTSINL